MKKKRTTDPFSYLWLIPTLGFSLMSTGRWGVPAAAWLSLVFLLRFTRAHKPLTGYIVGSVTVALAEYYGWKGLIPLPQPFYSVFILFTALFSLLPFLADRLISSRLKGPFSTLVFPSAFTFAGYLGTLADSGSWGAVAYTQWGNLPLLQLVSLTGMWGITFLLGWFASLLNWAWEQKFAWKKIRAGVLVFAGILCATLVFGGSRLTLFPPSSATVTSAGITTSQSHFDVMTRFMPMFMTPIEVDAPELDDFREKAAETHEDMMTQSLGAARLGARIVAWSEGAVLVLKKDEADLLARGGTLAREEGIYLLMTLLTWDPTTTPPLENKAVLFTPGGAMAWEFKKARPVPGPEMTLTGPGNEKIPVYESPYGRIGAVICFDADFVDLLQQAGRSEIDILIVPANDWPDITPLHSHMAAMRAIEQGFSLLRPTSNGLSAAFDYQGRTLATLNTFRSQARVMLAQLPMQGTNTIYARTGDVFAWGSLALFLVVTMLSLRQGRRKKTPNQKAGDKMQKSE